MMTQPRCFLMRLTLAALFAFALCVDVQAGSGPVATDSRIRTFVYGENEVFKVVAEYGYQSNVEFSEKELIKTISVGDPVAFRVTPAGNRLFIKAMEEGKHTNMTVVTTKHAYQFDLFSTVKDDKDLVYVARFFYPDEDFDAPPQNQPVTAGGGAGSFTSKEVLKQNYNFNYSLTGPGHLAPLRVFDDGQYTFFKFAQGEENIPRIYEVSFDGSETPLVTRRDGEYVIVERILPRLSLRHGPDVVCVYNDSLVPR